MTLLESIRYYGKARRELFAANDAWLAGGKPENGPLAVEWHRSRGEHSAALAALNKIADNEDNWRDQ